MPSRVSYGNSRLIPAPPAISVSKAFQTTGDGEPIGTVFQIAINGTICAEKGSPNSSGVFHTTSGYPSDETIAADARLGAILRKQEAIRELFSIHGLTFEIQSADGSPPLKCNPRVLDIQFEEGIWFNLCNYTITLEADVIYVNGTAIGEDDFSSYISDASETWEIRSEDNRFEADDIPTTYILTHNVSATGKRFYDDTGTLSKAAWKQARDWVLPKLGFDSTIALSSGVNNLPDYYNGYNHIRSESVDEKGGSFSVTETWVMASGTATEDFTVNITSSIDQPNTQVSIQGTIRGFEQRDSNYNVVTRAIDNAEVKWSGVQTDLIARAQAYSQLTLNTSPLSNTVGKNPITGVINYGYEYNNRPSNELTGSISEVITLDDSYNVDVFGSVPVIGRVLGPVLQAINTKEARTRTLNMEIVFDPDVAGNGSVTSRFKTNHPQVRSPQSGEIQNIIDSLTPGYSNKLFISNNNEQWDGISRYSRSITWTYE